VDPSLGIPIAHFVHHLSVSQVDDRRSSTNSQLSVVVPSYNHDKFIGYAVASALSQNVDLELIIVDDSSSDRSTEIIRTWMRKDNRIKALFHVQNQGIARTINDGIKLAQGNYLAIMASDDMFKSNALAKVVRLLDLHQDCDVAVINAECIDARNMCLGVLFSDIYGKPSISEGNFFNDLIRGKLEHIMTAVIRRSAIVKNGIYFNEQLKYSNDDLFWFDLTRACRCIYVDEPLYYYRLHEKGSSLDTDGFFERDFQVYQHMLSRYRNELDGRTKSTLSIYARLLNVLAPQPSFIKFLAVWAWQHRSRRKTLLRKLRRSSLDAVEDRSAK
jgi:glycosyltransferase involved in cell wall biosynthesis